MRLGFLQLLYAQREISFRASQSSTRGFVFEISQMSWGFWLLGKCRSTRDFCSRLAFIRWRLWITEVWFYDCSCIRFKWRLGGRIVILIVVCVGKRKLFHLFLLRHGCSNINYLLFIFVYHYENCVYYKIHTCCHPICFGTLNSCQQDYARCTWLIIFGRKLWYLLSQ